MSRHNGEPIGIECKVEQRDAWAFVLPNVSGPDPYRIQYFDRTGFISHRCCADLVRAVEEMIVDGYRREDTGALDRCASTPEWRIGQLRAAVVQRHLEGLISYQTMMQELISIAA
jgi:hypothetical protein